MAFDYDRDGPKEKVVLSGEPLGPRRRIVVENILAGATREWICVEYDMTPELIGMHLANARKKGYNLKWGVGSEQSNKSKRALIRKALLENWDVSVHDLKTLCRCQNERSLRVIRSSLRAELREEFPGRFPDKKELVSGAVCRKALIHHWNLTPAKLAVITGYPNNYNFHKALKKARLKLFRDYPEIFSKKVKSGDVFGAIGRKTLIRHWDVSNANLAKIMGYPHDKTFKDMMSRRRRMLREEFPDRFK